MSQSHRRGFLVVALIACALALAPAGAADDGGAAPAPSHDLIAKLADADAVAGALERSSATDELVKRGAAVVPELVTALADPRLRVGVAGVLERLGPVAKEAVAALVAAARGSGSPRRAACVRALGAIGADALPGLSVLTTIVSSTKAKDRMDAAIAVERILLAVAKATPRTAAADVDRAISDGCDWLVRHQSKAGSFDCDDFEGACVGTTKCSGAGDPAYDVGVTGLATLALLGETFPPAAGRKEPIDAALAYLASTQTADGHFGPQTSQHHNYNHACAALAIADAVARTGRADLRGPMEGGVKWVLAARNPYLAWRYGRADGDNDTSVTVWMMKALQRAADAGIPMDSNCREGALGWVEHVTESEFGRVGYQKRGGQPGRTSEMLGNFPPTESESLTACALVVRLGVGQSRESEAMVAQGLALLAARRPRWDGRGSSVDLYYWMHGSEAVRLAGGVDYVRWRRDLFAALLPHQVAPKKSCDGGSWPPDDPWSVEGGRVYATAAALLALEACAVDPATRPALPLGGNAAVDALANAANEPDPALAAVAARAADRISNAFRP
ncbi:MAG: hypothetical protein K8T90_02460 [Planctomycetes bacterium]|nr:hypothetical protein [Planctomycetota bacterium]